MLQTKQRKDEEMRHRDQDLAQGRWKIFPGNTRRKVSDN